ncbi:uncharacterized protein LOC142572848 [Dermacentor variabilis]|uniref:uncharacterized protein LOC142572848 n=1 Tax=Dermacentor variabilis TaxID=34621 RepID=UPI003F5C3413
MDKDSADRFKSPTPEASSATFRRRQHTDRPNSLPKHKTSPTDKDVTCHKAVESTTNPLISDVGSLEAAEQGSTEAAKDVADNTFHPDTSCRGGAHRLCKSKSGFTSRGNRHSHRKRSRERGSVKSVESKEQPIAVADTSSGSPLIECNNALLCSETSGAMRPDVSDTSQKKAVKPPQERASQHAAPSAHVPRPQMPELFSAFDSRSRSRSKKRATSTSSLKKRERPNKSAPAPVSPLGPTALAPPFGQSDDGNLAVLDVYRTSANENPMSPSTASEAAWSAYTLGEMSRTRDQVSLALAPIMVPAPFVLRSPADSSPQSDFSPNAARRLPSPASLGLAEGRAPLSSSHKVSPTSPVPVLPQHVVDPRGPYASSTTPTKDPSSFSTIPPGHNQPADAPMSTGLEESSTTAIYRAQPFLGEITSSMFGSKVESSAASLSGTGSGMPFQRNKLDHLSKSGTQTESVGTRRRITSLGVSATSFWEIKQAAASRMTGRSVMCGLCCIVVISSVTLVPLTLIFLANRTHSTYIEECSTAACDRAMTSFWALMEDSVDPCQDFYGHVCHRWDNSTGGRLKYLDHSVQQIARRVNQSLHDVDEFGSASHETRGVAQFYKLCFRFVNSRDRYISRSQIMQSFGAEKRDRLLTMTNFGDIVATLIDLSLSRGLNTVFGVKLVRRAGAAQVNVFPGKTLAETIGPHSADAWRGYLHKLLVELSATYPSRKFDVDSVQRTDDTVKQLLASPDVDDNTREQVDAGSLNFLGDATSTNTWLAAVNSHLPSDEQLSGKSKVLVTGYGTVRNVLQFLGSLADYGVAYLYLHLLLEVFRFDYVRSLQHRSPVDQVRECLQASQDAMWHTRKILTANIFGGRRERNQESADILRMVAQAASSRVRLSWMGDLMRRRAQKLFSTVSLHVHDLYAWNATSSVIGERAEALVLGARAIDFPSIYVRLKEEQNRAFLSNSRADSHPHGTLHVLDTGVLYDAGANEVVVPASLRVEPALYSADVPFAFSAGTLGTLMATELYRAAMPHQASPIWHQQQRDVMAKFQDCTEILANDALNISLAALGDGVGDGHGLPSHMFWMLGARTAYETLGLATFTHKHPINWSSYWRTWQRTFFRRFCLLTCGSGEEDNERSGVTHRVLCLLTVASMPQFSQVFGCQDHSTALKYTTCIMD